jgi:hypothetical protein
MPERDEVPLEAPLFMAALPGGVVDAEVGPLLPHASSINKTIRPHVPRMPRDGVGPSLQKLLAILISNSVLFAPANSAGLRQIS